MRHPAGPWAPLPLLAVLASCTGELVGADEADEVDEAYIHNGSYDDEHLAVGLIESEYLYTVATCTGTLITPDAVLTAGHCVHKGTTSFSIQTGWFLFWPTFDWLPVTTKVAAPGYGFDDQGRIQHDLAILRLDGTFEGVEPMPIAAAPPEVGSPVTVVGYGQYQAGPQAGSSYTKVRRMGSSWIDEVREDVLVGSDEEGTVCWGDSGGPMLFEADGVESVVGVHSKLLRRPDGTRGQCGDPFADARPDLELAWIAEQACIPEHGLGTLPEGCVPRLPDCACQ